MKKKIISLFLAVVMIVGMVPLGAITAFAETGEIEYRKLYSSSSGQTIGEYDTVSYYYVDSDTSCTATEPKVSGLSIADWSEVHIRVDAGATLTCKGGDASGFMGGGAGIEVPEHATLYLEGEGTVIATGGNAGDGVKGGVGESGEFEEESPVFLTYYYYYGGNGGAGGNGGSGAGAGIGTIGSGAGKGGAGGKGDGGEVDKDHLNVTAGEKGADAQPVNQAGTVRTSRTVKLTAVGGARGKGGENGGLYGLVNEEKDYYNTAVPGCGGGGGQGGGAGASVGNGGQGGGGGAGGNGGPAIYSSGNGYFGAKLYSGYGGGNTDGNYIAGSNMGKGGSELLFINSVNTRLWDSYPYKERNFGGAGGADGIHIHTFDEDGWCIECAKQIWLIEDGVLLEYNGFGGTVVIPEGVTKIANGVFNGNKTVTDVVFPSTLEEIGSSAFQGLTLTSIDIPASVKAIGNNAFRNCASLRNVTVHWTKENEIVTPQSDAFAGIASDCALSVPQNTAALYKKNPVWGKFSLISDTMLYMAYDPETETLVQKTSPVAPTTITSSDGSVVLPGGWYAAGDATIGGSLTFEGDAYVIFENGKTLTVNGGVVVGSELTFYAQTTALDDMGGLYVPGTAGEVPGISCSGKTLNIHGGNIKVWGGNYAAGIGGAKREYGGYVTVYGGHVEAHSKNEGAGIGGGQSGTGGTFTIYGGKVDAHGSYSSGIGGGRNGAGGTITINGGEVHSHGNIGAFEYNNNNGTTITINGGKVTVDGTIGGRGSTVNINGGEVKVNQGTIGAGNRSGYSTVNIRGGIVDANNSYYMAIGGDTNDNIYIYGGSIKAKSDNADAVVASSVKVYPNAEKCEIFTVKDFSGNELSGSPVSEEKEINDILSENKQIKIDLDHAHTFINTYVNNGDGTHSLKCDVCGVLNAAEAHTFVHHACVCGVTNDHNFTGEYKDNGDGTHSRKCTVCDKYGTPVNHTFVNHECVCGAHNEHSFTGEYKYNGNGTHSRKCTECGEYGASEAHTWQSVDKYTHKCTVCDTVENHTDSNKDSVCDECEYVLCYHENTVINYTWGEDYQSCTATKHCNDCGNDILTENATEIKLIEDTHGANCQTMGKGHYEATFATLGTAKTAENGVDTTKGEHHYIDFICEYCHEEDLEGAKANAIDELAAAITTDFSNKVYARTIEKLNAATTVEEVEAIKNAALAEMKEADALYLAMTNAMAEITAATTETTQTIADEAINNIKAATTVETIEEIRDEALAKMKEAMDELAAAKLAAVQAIIAAETENNAALIEMFLPSVYSATTVEQVTSVKVLALLVMDFSDTAFGALRTLDAARTDRNSEIASKALDEISKLTGDIGSMIYSGLGDGTAEEKLNAYKAEVNAILEKALADMRTADFYAGMSLTLGSDIAINFYVELSEEARQNGTMTFDIGGRIVTLKGTDAKWNETEKKYYFQTPLTALEMNETVKATFTYNGIEYVQEYSVQQYIDKIVSDSEKYGEKAVALAKKIANYGYYAQIYLESIHTNVVIGDDGYAAMFKFDDVDIDVAKAIEALAKYSVTVTGESDNISLYGSTVYFDSATALNYYVTVKDGTAPTATAVNTKTGKSKDVEIKLYKDKIYIVSVKDITATELADDIKVTIDDDITVTGSVFAYCNSVVQAHDIVGATEKDKFAVDAMAAFYEYYDAAVKYAKTQVQE